MSVIGLLAYQLKKKKESTMTKADTFEGAIGSSFPEKATRLE